MRDSFRYSIQVFEASNHIGTQSYFSFSITTALGFLSAMSLLDPSALIATQIKYQNFLLALIRINVCPTLQFFASAFSR
jgi:uncharacterized membrane protein